MSFTNYGTLKTKIKEYLRRENTVTDAQVDDWTLMGESRINNGSAEVGFESPPLRHTYMEAKDNLTINAQEVALPTGFLEANYIYLTTDPIRLLIRQSPARFWGRWTSTVGGRPREFCEENGNFVFGPTPDQSYTGKLSHYKKLTALSADGDTNSLLTNEPMMYLAAILTEAFHDMRDMTQAQMWLAKHRGAVIALNRTHQRTRHSGQQRQRPRAIA